MLTSQLHGTLFLEGDILKAGTEERSSDVN